jgi:glutamate synthase domain-containing protein 2
MNCCTCSFCGVGSCCNDCWDGGEYGGTTKTGRHDIAEILLEVALKHQKAIKSNQRYRLLGVSFLYRKQVNAGDVKFGDLCLKIFVHSRLFSVFRYNFVEFTAL